MTGTYGFLSRLFDPAKCEADYDLKLSTVLFDGDEPCGLFLAIRADEAMRHSERTWRV